ncbi:hypothetical protein BD408DRAFT_412256 [Parasitella parasitica]|nr:hypothetical protein BD408DRAFT_412256 [Parasitella parasitica]
MYLPIMAISMLLLLLTVAATVDKNGDCSALTGELSCRYNCGSLLQGICVEGACYCTDIGTGNCKIGNNEAGCKDICNFLAKPSSGCYEGQCVCH